MEWTYDQKSAVWNKAEQASNNDPNKFRKDQCDAWIQWAEHGNRNSQYGWEIDHIIPLSQGGPNNISNLRALQWQNNASRGDGRLVCAVISSGTKNVTVK